jgi:hypothetical protein
MDRNYKIIFTGFISIHETKIYTLNIIHDWKPIYTSDNIIIQKVSRKQVEHSV